MAIEQKRIEAAMRAYLASPSTLEARAMVTGILNAAYPELESDPPKAWVAPWIATEAMRTSMARVTSDEQRVDATVHRSKAKIYEAMRDAHLKEQGHE